LLKFALQLLHWPVDTSLWRISTTMRVPDTNHNRKPKSPNFKP